MIFDINSVTDRELVKKSLEGCENIGFTSGSFDLYHHMHLAYLRRCRRLCDLLIVGLDSDDLIKDRKGPGRPFVVEHQRLEIIGDSKQVHAAFIMGGVQDFELAVEVFGVHTIFKNEQFGQKGEKILGSDRAKVIILEDLIQYSSTSQLAEAIQRLGREDDERRAVR